MNSVWSISQNSPKNTSNNSLTPWWVLHKTCPIFSQTKTSIWVFLHSKKRLAFGCWIDKKMIWCCLDTISCCNTETLYAEFISPPLHTNTHTHTPYIIALQRVEQARMLKFVYIQATAQWCNVEEMKWKWLIMEAKSLDGESGHDKMHTLVK